MTNNPTITSEQIISSMQSALAASQKRIRQLEKPRKKSAINLRSEKQRQALTQRPAPYFETIAPSKALGWRAYHAGLGVWVARNGGKVRTMPGSESFTYEEALIAVLEAFKIADAPAPAITVAQAIDNYVADLRKRKGISAEKSTRKRLEKHVPPAMLKTAVIDLDKEMLRSWMHSLPGQASSVNRVRAMMIAALNLTDCDPAAWRKLKALPTGDNARKLLLSSEDLDKLLSVTSGAFHNLLKAATLTGARLGELRSLTVADLDNGMLTLNGKTGKRIIPLRHDARVFFEAQKSVFGNPEITFNAPLLPASDGREWKPGNHSAPMRKAVKQAGLSSETVFYSLRHSFISSCVRDGLPILAVAQYCGTSVAMIQAHYGHFQSDNMRAMVDSVAL